MKIIYSRRAPLIELKGNQGEELDKLRITADSASKFGLEYYRFTTYRANYDEASVCYKHFNPYSTPCKQLKSSIESKLNFRKGVNLQRKDIIQ